MNTIIYTVIKNTCNQKLIKSDQKLLQDFQTIDKENNIHFTHV